MADGGELKVCTKCWRTKPIAEFRVTKGFGHANTCRDCWGLKENSVLEWPDTLNPIDDEDKES